jgi:iron complex transport system ATP-binding protein
MDETIISARELGCQSGNRYLLKNINWDITEKSRWIILGMNGCGKTTLLSILSGYQDYTYGTITYRGRDYREQDIMGIRKKMGLISNSYFDRIYQHESVQDLTLSGLSGTLGLEDGATTAAHVRKLKRLLEQVGLPDKLDCSYSWLSKGERQNILIVRALLAQPEVMVLDEPMTGLDVVSKQKMMRFVQGMAEEQNHTILYVTHHFEEISPDLFDYCLLLRHGQIYQMGPMEDVMQNDVISSFLRQSVRLDRMKNGYYHLEFQR